MNILFAKVSGKKGSNRVFRTAASFSLGALLIGSIQYANADNNDNRKRNNGKQAYVQVNNQLVAVQGALTSIQDQINLLVARVDTVEQRLAANVDAVVVLQAQNQVLQALISQNLSDVLAINNQIQVLQQENSNLQSQIISNSGDILALKTQVESNTALITTLQQAVLLVQNNVINLGTSLQAQVDNNSELISNLQAEILVINDGLIMKQNLVDGICPDGSAVTQIMPNGSVICGDITGGSGSGTGTGSGGAIGRLITVKAFTEMVAGPGGIVNTTTTCPEGFLATGYGWALGLNWSIINNGMNTLGVSYFQAKNNNTFTTNIFHVVTCSSII